MDSNPKSRFRVYLAFLTPVLFLLGFGSDVIPGARPIAWTVIVFALALYPFFRFYSKALFWLCLAFAAACHALFIWKGIEFFATWPNIALLAPIVGESFLIALLFLRVLRPSSLS
jgi:hypothetical protein